MMTTTVIEKPKAFKSVKKSNRIANIASYIVLGVLALIWMFPIVWIILNAFRNEYNTSGQLVGIVVSHYFPTQLGLENFKLLFTETLFPQWFLNTMLVSVFTFILSTFLTLCVAYVMSKLKFKMRKKFLGVAIILGLFPGFMSMIAIYYILKDFNDWRIRNIIAIGIGIAIGLAISMMSPAKENDNLWFVFLCGIIGVSGMTLPGLSGSFILILLGNYVLLLVDSVNELYKVIIDIFKWNFDFIHDEERMRYMKIISSFTLGSMVGLVISSHILAFLLKRWHQIVTSVIIGFISGSLGIVWPWKKVIYKINEHGEVLIDSQGDKVIENFVRYIPDLHDSTTWVAIGFILVGILTLLSLELYGRRKYYK
jgi:uncharacterized membrane protein